MKRKKTTGFMLCMLIAALLLCSGAAAAEAFSPAWNEPFLPGDMPFLAIASSEYQLKYNTEYTVGAAMAVDGELNTAWNEGAPGSGVGEWIRLLPADGGRYTYRGFMIANGFQYHDYWKGDRWVKNNRVRYLMVLNERQEMVSYHEIADVPNGYQYFFFDEPVAANYLEFKIVGVWEGDKFSETCISELRPF